MESFIQQSLQSGQFSLLMLPVVLAAGLLTSLSPCVYPLLPITVGVVAGKGEQQRPLVNFGHVLIYVAGLALVYGLLGLLAALTGQLFGTVASHPLTLLLIANLCLLLAGWMLGWLSLPNWALQADPGRWGLGRRSYLFVMGALSGLIAAPCTSPVLGMLLIYVAAAGNPLWGALLLVLFAYGMSALLILVGTFSPLIHRLPKAGRWMNLSKTILALLMVGVSEYLLMQAGRGL
ncbi:cytochrome c biogenesis protein CcdA [Marinobacterium arenosum]|uniref:cytochrome c biogenesis protein CcdA n=1 Tax=Marinobacterium arenosum TaxID=2862496 RepID=UPI001C955963|nr:cytochrome c biogenesis protein CcdA [Marinobacterium arenosum]MBY4677752.1 sulfite exporter TauE/SafE family protein [Marinobacterium arenosum]